MFMCTLDKEKLTKNQDKEERKFSWFSIKKIINRYHRECNEFRKENFSVETNSDLFNQKKFIYLTHLNWLLNLKIYKLKENFPINRKQKASVIKETYFVLFL